MKKLLFMLLSASLVFVACSTKETEEPIRFEPYEKIVKVATSYGDSVKFAMLLDVPVAGGYQKNLEQGMMEIIAMTDIDSCLNNPQGETLKELAESYVAAYKGSKPEVNMHVFVKLMYLNEACAVFYVDSEGGEFPASMKTEKVVRLEDGHVMSRNEIVDISEKDIIALAREHADESQIGEIEIEGEYSFSVGSTPNSTALWSMTSRMRLQSPISPKLANSCSRQSIYRQSSRMPRWKSARENWPNLNCRDLSGSWIPICLESLRLTSSARTACALPLTDGTTMTRSEQ